MFSSSRRLQKRKASLITAVQSAAVNHANYTRICGRRHARSCTRVLYPCLHVGWKWLRSMARILWKFIVQLIHCFGSLAMRGIAHGILSSRHPIYSRSVKGSIKRYVANEKNRSRLIGRCLETCIRTITPVVMNKFKKIVKYIFRNFPGSVFCSLSLCTRNIRFIINLLYKGARVKARVMQFVLHWCFPKIRLILRNEIICCSL